MAEDKSIKIVVATHKKYEMPLDDLYFPLHVGAEGKNTDLGYTKDNTGDNISTLNSSFCELTGLYWAWKNLKADYIGLVHYRRHFCAKRKNNKPIDNVLTSDEAQKLVNNFDIIVPRKRRYFIESLYSHYEHTHYVSQLDAAREIIKERYPEYMSDYEQVIRQRWGYMFNMMILRRDYMEDYCTWLFSILFELKKMVEDGRVENSSSLSYFQGRFYGRVSEILFNVWLTHQLKEGKVKKIKELSCISMEKIAWGRKIRSFFYAKFFGKKYEGSF